MIGNSFRKLLFIVLCASMLSIATPIGAFSARIALKSALTKIKKFASLDYLLHCDCPKHKKNQTFKNQIRRHPERVGIYLAAGAGLLLASYKLFTSSMNNTTIPQPPRPPMPPVPVEPVVAHVNPTPIVIPIIPEPKPQPEPIILARPRPQPTPVEFVDIASPIEHEAGIIHIPARPIRIATNFNQVKAVNLQPIETQLNSSIIEEPIKTIQIPVASAPNTAPFNDSFSDLSLSQTRKPDSPIPTQEESPREISDKGKEEASPNHSNSAISSFVLIPNDNNTLKSSLSQPLQNLLNLGLKDIPCTNIQDDPEELLLLGAACNYALITNNEDVINLLAQDHPRVVRALIWYYYALAAGKEQTFEEGTFLMVHPKAQVIINFLKKGAYERISSHFPATKEQHYGLDINDLPTKKQTLLFGHVDREQNSIFIKPERHGTNTYTDLALHAVSYAQSVGVKIQAKLIGGPSADDSENFRKERIPVEMLRSFNILTQELLNLEKISPDQANQLNRTARERGIACMHEEVTHMIPQFASTPAIQAQALEFINEMNTYDHKNHRLGREVILTTVELEEIVTRDDFHHLIRHFYLTPSPNNLKSD